jgi:hypothetical protein
MKESKWSWGFTRGLPWAGGSAVGALMGLVQTVVSRMAYANDPSPLLLVLAAAGLALWLGGA